MNSDSSYIDIALKIKQWVAADVPTQANRDAFLHFKGRQIDENVQPRASAWLNKMSGFSEVEMKGWPEYHKDDAKGKNVLEPS